MGKADALASMMKQSMASSVQPAQRTIETITGEILDAQQRGGEAILTIGRCLIEAKELLPHGEWLPWLNERVSYSERTARRFMQMYRKLSNRPALADLGKSKAMALLAMPEKDRDEFLAENNVADMTTRQLEQAIKERDQARQAAEQAEADKRAAEQARDKMAEDMAIANAALEATREERQRADAEARRLESELSDLKARPVEVAVETVVDQAAIDQARAQAIAEMQDKLDKAREKQKQAEARQQQVQAQLEETRRKLEEREKAERKDALSGDKEFAQFEVLFNQAKEHANQLHGLLLKARGREDQTVAQGMEKALKALADAIGRCAE